MSTSRASAYPNATVAQKEGHYETLCKFVLRQRLVNVFTHSVCVTWALLSASTIPWQSSFIDIILHPIRVWTLFWTLFAFMLAIMPLLVYKKLVLAPRKTSTKPTASQQLRQTLSTASTWYAVAVYNFSGIVLAMCFIFLLPGDWRARIWKPTKLYPHHLNETISLLLLSNISFATLFAIYSLVSQRSALEWPSTGSKTHPETTLVAALLDTRRTKSMMEVIGAAWVVFAAGYILFRRPWYQFAAYLLRPFVKHFLRRGIPWKDLLLRASSLNLVTGITWYICETVFSVNASQPLSVSQHTLGISPTECLISGIKSKSNDGYYQRFAMAEISELAQGSSPSQAARRKALFSDLRTPSPWSTFCRETLLLLGKDYQNLVRRGKPTPPVLAAKAIAPPKPTLTSVPRTPSALKRTNIYAAPARSPSDRIASNVSGFLDTADQIVDRFPDLQSKLANVSVRAPIDDLRRSISGSIPAIFAATNETQPTSSDGAVVAAPPSTVSSLSSVRQKWTNFRNQQPALSQGLQGIEKVTNHLTREFFHAKVERELAMVLPNLTLDVWAIEALCHLTARSFTEDPYGMVQKDIPRILEAIILLERATQQYKLEIEKTRDEVAAGNLPAGYQDDLETIERCCEQVDRLLLALNTGLHEIGVTFKDRLTAFRFPPSIAKSVQDLMDRSL